MHDAAVYRQVAELHASNIDQGFLSSLGPRFLSLLYEAIDTHPSSVLLLAWHDGKLVGFVSGAQGMGAIYRQLLRRWFRLGLALLPALLSPAKVWKIAEIVLLGSKAPPVAHLPHAELLSIAVDPAHRGHGHAQSLYEQLVAHFTAQGLTGFKIVVGETLGPAHRFYTRLGAKPVANMEVHKSQRSTVYVHTLVATAPLEKSAINTTA